MIVYVTADAGGAALSVKKSLMLCYEAVIPSMFPGFILCGALAQALGALPLEPSAGLFLSSLFTGFPTGVRAVCEAYSAGRIDKARAEALLHCTANASPAYLYAFIGISVIGSAGAGAILLAAQTVCAATVAGALGCFGGRRRAAGAISVTEAAVRSVDGAVRGILGVCGYVIFFGVFADAVKGAGPLAAGALEITRGVKALDFTEPYALELCALIVGFSGISVIMQCVSYVLPAGLPVKAVLTGKAVYTAMMPAVVHVLKRTADTEPGTRNASGAVTAALFIIFLLFCGAAAHNIFDKRAKMRYNMSGDENDLFKRRNAGVRVLRARTADRDYGRRYLRKKRNSEGGRKL